MKERLSGIKDKTEGIYNFVKKKKVKSKIFQAPAPPKKIQEAWETRKD